MNSANGDAGKGTYVRMLDPTVSRVKLAPPRTSSSKLRSLRLGRSLQQTNSDTRNGLNRSENFSCCLSLGMRGTEGRFDREMMHSLAPFPQKPFRKSAKVDHLHLCIVKLVPGMLMLPCIRGYQSFKSFRENFFQRRGGE